VDWDVGCEQGAAGKKIEKNNQCTYFTWPGKILDVRFRELLLVAFLSSPHREMPKNAIKKIDKGRKVRRATP
jgi:hypothetical protein